MTGLHRLLLFFPGLFLILPIVAVSTVSAGTITANSTGNNENPPVIQGPTRSEVFRLTGPGVVQISNLMGDITVRETESDEIRIEMYEKRSFTLWGEQRRSEHRYIIVRQKNDITVNIEPGGGAAVGRPRAGPDISFVVYAPPYMEMIIKTGYGNINARGLGNNHDLRTGAGNIYVERSTGEGRVLTSAGNIEVNRYKGTLMCMSAGGNITLEDIQGTVRAKTMGGHVRADKFDGSLQAESGGGNINTRIISLKDGLYLQTGAGNITAELPTGIGLDIVMKGSSTVLGNASTFRGSKKNTEIEGVVQGGGTTVNLFTNAGKAEIIFIRNTP